MTKQSKRKYLATGGGLFAIIIWSLTISLTRRISEQIGPVSGAASVYIVSSILGVTTLFLSRKKWQNIVRMPRNYLVICGSLFVGYMLLLFLAVGIADSRNQVLEIGIINYLWPSITLVLSVFILRHKATWFLFPGTILALLGIFLVLTSTSSITLASFLSNFKSKPEPYLLALAAALFWGLYSTLTRKWAGKIEGDAVIVFLFISGFTFFIISQFVEESRNWNTRVFIEVLFFGIATFVAYSLWDRSMRMGNMVLVSASSYLIPLFSTVVNTIYLSVIPSLQLWIGCSILIVGSILSWISIVESRT